MSSATHTLAPSHCPNCAQDLDPQDRFCRHCGQDTANHPPTLFEFVHEFVAHYVAAEGKLWKSLAGLMFRPGFLTREYLAGRKQRYVLPLRLLLTFGLLFFFTLKLMPSGAEVHGAVAESLEAPAASASSASSTSAPPLRLPTGKNVNFKLSPDVVDSVPPFAQDRVRRAVARWQQDPEGATRSTLSAMLAWAPYAVLASLPFFTALLKLLYRQQPYGAHFVFALHLHAAWYLMLTFLVLVSWEWTPAVVALWASVYAWMALRRVYGKSWLGTLLRAVPLCVAHSLLIANGFLLLAVTGALSVG